MDVTQQPMCGPIYVQHMIAPRRATFAWTVAGTPRRLPLKQLPARAIVMPQRGVVPELWL